MNEREVYLLEYLLDLSNQLTLAKHYLLNIQELAMTFEFREDDEEARDHIGDILANSEAALEAIDSDWIDEDDYSNN